MTCSCSGAMTQSGGLTKVVQDAAADAERQVGSVLLVAAHALTFNEFCFSLVDGSDRCSSRRRETGEEDALGSCTARTGCRKLCGWCKYHLRW
jgi:hypothetical protein